MKKRDIYVHADMPGAASCVILNPSTLDISPVTLNEAGTWAVCHSKAWNDNKLFPAFWVWGNQVSKTPESGEYLVTGSFIIRGKKTFINPPKLELGYTVLFVLDDISMLNHQNERRLRGANEDGDMELLRNTSETLEEEV